MARFTARLVLASLVAWMALPAGARADDTELFAKGNVPPNVLVILDTSQSMSWFNKDGATVGDEFCYPTSNCYPVDPSSPPSNMSRMWAAKSVLSDVVTQYSDKINFGLAGYNQGDPSTNAVVMKAGNGAPMSWYYSTGWSKIPFDGWRAYTFGTNYYFYPWYFDLRVPQTGLGGPASATDLAGYNPATLKPNSPSFTLSWALRSAADAGKPSNPWREFYAGHAYIPPTTHNEDRCRSIAQRSPDQVTWTDYGGTWDTAVGGGCPAAGSITTGDTYTAAVTITDTCTFVTRLTGDIPTPYQYRCQRYTNGSPTGGPWFEYYQDTQGATFNRNVWSAAAYYQHTKSLGQVTITVTDNPGQAYSPDYYRWWYYYEVNCSASNPSANCQNVKNMGKYWSWSWASPWYPDDATCKAGQVNDPYVDPPNLGLPGCGSGWKNASNQPVWVPSATGAWGVPYDATYNWQGNNYNLVTDTSCTASNGATLLVDVGSGTSDDIKNFLGTGTDPTKELHGANYSTPLAGSLDSALAYFTDPEGVVMTDAMKQCRKNFVLLVTDGGESCLIDLTVPGQKAAALANLSDPAGGVKTYVVGLDQGGLSTDEKTVLTSIATFGGSGDYHKASDTTSLKAALDAILGEILSQQYSFASIIVPRMRFKDNLIAIQGAMLPNTATNVPFWKGFLAAYKLNDDGTLPTDASHLLDPTQVVQYWEASDVLWKTSPGSRNIYITVFDWSDPDWHNWGYKRIDFKPDTRVYNAIGCPGGSWTFDGTQWVFTKFPDVTGDKKVDNNDCPAFVNLLRGNDAYAWGSRLGDIFHSQPVVVGSPSPTFVDTTFDPNIPTVNLPLSVAPSTYTAFRNAQSTRTRIVVVGANDGFLHAFNAGNWDSVQAAYDTGTGAEEWAYVPFNVNTSILNLGYKQGAHHYFVDGTPKVADVWLDDNNDGVKAADGSEWHTVALVNLRQGGTGIFPLDITDTKNPRPLNYGNFHYPIFSTCGLSFSEPAIGKVKMQVGGKKVDRWVAFFGDGDYSTSKTPSPTCGKRFWVYDLQTGNPIWYVYNKSLFGGPTDETQYMTYDMVGSPIALDTDGDGYVDRVYVGDRGGQIWRFDVSALATHGGGDVNPVNWWIGMVDNWTVSRLFAGPSTQMFYERLAASLDAQGKLWVFGGTGDRRNPLIIDPADATTPSKGRDGRLYGIKDTYVSGSAAPAVWTEADLEDVTGNNTVDPSALSKPGGWRIKLDRGEKNFTTVEVFNKVVYFSTEVPQPTITGSGCSTSPATARLYYLYYLTGGGITDLAAFTSSSPTPSARYVDIGAGAPIRTVISTLTLGGGAVLVAGNSQQGIYFGKGDGTGNIPFYAPPNLRYTKYWRTN